MKMIEKGHMYEINIYDGPLRWGSNTLTFFKRVGVGYPGNEGSPHPGTNCQEVLRVLIDRVKYLEGQISCEEDGHILRNLRLALYAFELRAARRHGLEKEFLKLATDHVVNEIEDQPHCSTCGHIICHHREENKNEAVRDAC